MQQKAGPVFSRAYDGILGRAVREAQELGHAEVGPEHFLLALIRRGDAAGRVFEARGVTYEIARNAVQDAMPKLTCDVSAVPQLGEVAKQVVGVAVSQARRYGDSVQPWHLLLALVVAGGKGIRTLLERLGIDQEDLRSRAIAVGKVTKRSVPIAQEVDYGQAARDVSVLTDAISLMRRDVDSLKDQVEKAQDAGRSPAIMDIVQQAVERLEHIIERTQEISPPYVLPPVDDMKVRLVPSHWLERLDEYRSDAELAWLLTGAFGGAILGILVNWATSEKFVVTAFSLVLLGLLALLCLVSAAWAHRLGQRASVLRSKLLGRVTSTAPVAAGTVEDVVAPIDDVVS